MRFRFDVAIALKQAKGLQETPEPSVGDLQMSFDNLTRLLADPTLSAAEKAALLQARDLILALLRKHGADPNDGLAPRR